MTAWLTSIWNSTDSLATVATLANWGIATTLVVGCLCTAVSIIALNRKDALLNNGVELAREERIARANQLAADGRNARFNWRSTPKGPEPNKKGSRFAVGA